MSQEYRIGDKVTVGGIEFTKISDNPFGDDANAFIVINGHAPWCSYIRSLQPAGIEDEPCDCAGWDDADPCRCGAWDPVENAHTVSEHTLTTGGGS